MPLADEMGVSQNAVPFESDQDELTDLVRKIREAYWSDDAQFEFDFSNYDNALRQSKNKKNPETESSEPIWIDLCINRIIKAQRPSFQLNAQSFVDTENTLTAQIKTPRWTDGLRPRDRLRLAKALRIIRNEKSLLRATTKQISSSADGTFLP
ncbi:hypothetical protein [Hydrogenophaga sp.]|uniref:hypothetical protein n=1 Tax=Hydrogenophaga sp. TaxID=1904254 RepID=UPI00273678A7|nr:hypothetical protein [Hydrogenophaga sp.]MDP3883664.1 hypothetical protein [Hydrogenophaga sp.]